MAIVRIEGVDADGLQNLAGSHGWLARPGNDGASFQVRFAGHGIVGNCDQPGALTALFPLPSNAIDFAAGAIALAASAGTSIRAAVHVDWVTSGECKSGSDSLELLEPALQQAASSRLIVSGDAQSLLFGSGLSFGKVVAELHRAGTAPLQFLAVDLSGDRRQVVDQSKHQRIGRHQHRLNAPLSHLEREVPSLVAEGRSNRDVARLLSSAASTVERHVSSPFEKLNVQSRVEIATLAAAGHL